MTVCGMDFETTGLDSKKDRIVEVGAVIWSTTKGFPITLYSFFCYADDFPLIHPQAAEAHGLEASFLKEYGIPFAEGISRIEDDFTAIVAHNGTNFDKLFYKNECERAGIKPWEQPWIDTSMDLPYPERITTRKLIHLAAEYGFLNPFAHRAVFDVLTMLQIFQKFDAEAALEYSQQPLVTLQALVSYDDRELAKSTGYRWKAEDKQWIKTVRFPDVEKEKVKAKEANFKIRELQPKLI
jgi:DNA polymerase III subunit epsilon